MKTLPIAPLLFLVASIGFGQVRTWVGPGGVDSNPCTREQPCRNFSAAIAAAASDAEVVALASAGYGPVNITRSITILAPEGVHAAIAPSTGNAVTINAGDTAHVILRNLYLNSQGALTGIDADTVAALYVENFVISGFSSGYGIRFDPTTSGARLYVSDSTIRTCSVGLSVHRNVRSTIDSVRLYGHLVGFFAGGIEPDTPVVTIRNSLASGCDDGFVTNGATALIDNTEASNNSHIGFHSMGGMTLTRCVAAQNATGAYAGRLILFVCDPGVIVVSDSSFTSNGLGVGFSGCGFSTAYTRSNNTVRANLNDGGFTFPFLPQ